MQKVVIADFILPKKTIFIHVVYSETNARWKSVVPGNLENYF